MSVRFRKALALVSAAALVAGPLGTTGAYAQQRVEVGNAATVVGDVTMQAGGEKKKRDVKRKDRFAWGDRVSTDKKSQLQILLLDRTTFGLGASSQVIIDRYVYDPNAGRSAVVTFVKGALRFFSGRQDGANSAEVTTPAGRIGVRGTAVDMLVGEDAVAIAKNEAALAGVTSNKNEATLVLLRGPGSATAGGLTPGLVDVEGAGETVTLNAPGLAAYIPRAGAAPIGPFQISNGGLGQVQDQLAPEVARAAKGGGLLEKLIPVAIGAIAIGAILDGKSDNSSTNPQRPTAGTNTQQVPRVPNQTTSSIPGTSSAPSPNQPGK